MLIMTDVTSVKHYGKCAEVKTPTLCVAVITEDMYVNAAMDVTHHMFCRITSSETKVTVRCTGPQQFPHHFEHHFTNLVHFRTCSNVQLSSVW